MNDTSDAQNSEVLYGVEDATATITLNRPERMNTISGPMLNQLTIALRMADEDADVRAVILTGTGRALCAGLDVRGQTSEEKTDTNISDGVASSTTINLNHTPPTVLHERWIRPSSAHSTAARRIWHGSRAGL